MFVPLFLGALGYRWLEFPASPPPDLVAKGRLVYQNGAGLDRTLFDDKAVLGTWFDGRIRRPVDTVVLVSPNVVARWLGYLAEQEAWPNSELQARWSAAKNKLGHTLTFVVRLAAFPRLDPLEFGIGSPAQPKSLEGTRFRLDFLPRMQLTPLRATNSSLGHGRPNPYNSKNTILAPCLIGRSTP